ncbi:MAG: cellulase family glycosylhydrolase [Planctomycetota bacterium]|jgi:endo-1,4-beta-mannosidase
MMALSLTTGCMEGLSRSGSRTQWSEQKAWDWYDNQPWMVGCNYLPATACNQLEMWQAETFDPETIDRELGWAEDLGFNVIRVFLHDMMWAQDAEGFVKRIDQVLAIADDHNIKVMPILFDSCWNPLPKLGPQEIAQKYLHNSSWVQSPHRDTLTDMEQWPKLKAYVQGIVKRYRNDDRVLIWDVYNEPGNPNVPAYEKVETPHKGEYSLLLMKNAFDWIREMNPKQPLMASVWVGDWKKGNDTRLDQDTAGI